VEDKFILQRSLVEKPAGKWPCGKSNVWGQYHEVVDVFFLGLKSLADISVDTTLSEKHTASDVS
jgi:hypothetical protein